MINQKDRHLVEANLFCIDQWAFIHFLMFLNVFYVKYQENKKKKKKLNFLSNLILFHIFLEVFSFS